MKRSRPQYEASLRLLLESSDDGNLESSFETLSQMEIGEYVVALDDITLRSTFSPGAGSGRH